ncbi:MAG: hypothetical protein NZL90_02465 [Aquificaceae bacterium]|nr:hypothetical protein [Aquificaceae bacterium]MDW8237013.1 hypothetical protein [Aquificaceae bacterium]
MQSWQVGSAKSFKELELYLEGLEKVGKGWRGVVFRAKLGDLVLAIKVARSPQVLDSIKRESRVLSMLLGFEGFPQLRFFGEDFIAYDFIDGKIFKRASLSKAQRIQVFLQVLELIKTLDILGIDKGEMNKLDKNLIISQNKVYLIDFERARLSNKTHNLSKFLQLLSVEGVLPIYSAKELGVAYRKGESWVYKEVQNALERALSSAL